MATEQRTLTFSNEEMKRAVREVLTDPHNAAGTSLRNAMEETMVRVLANNRSCETTPEMLGDMIANGRQNSVRRAAFERLGNQALRMMTTSKIAVLNVEKVVAEDKCVAWVVVFRITYKLAGDGGA